MYVDLSCLCQARLSVRLSCKHGVLKTNKPIWMQIGTDDPRGKGMKQSTLGIKRSHDAEDKFGILSLFWTPLGRVLFWFLICSSTRIDQATCGHYATVSVSLVDYRHLGSDETVRSHPKSKKIIKETY